MAKFNLSRLYFDRSMYIRMLCLQSIASLVLLNLLKLGDESCALSSNSGKLIRVFLFCFFGSVEDEVSFLLLMVQLLERVCCSLLWDW